MNPQPTIFLSSIISEFYDLRGALKYFLGKSGFRVLMSEEPDFGADCGIDSLDNCLKQIEVSDYYFLIICNKPGTIFKLSDVETTVTFEEFRHYISLIEKGKSLNLIAFVRQHTWDNYQKKDTSVIHPLQIALIDELIHNSLFGDKKIGRWRYTFNKFADIIAVLETNQNGLFLESTRKTSIFRAYLKREITDILKLFVQKDTKTDSFQTITDYLNLPDLKFSDFLTPTLLTREQAARIKTFLTIIISRGTLLLKINRIFNYVAQGEFSRFDTKQVTYSFPEFIKLTIQTLEIMEKIFENSRTNEQFDEIRKRDAGSFYICEAEYILIHHTFIDLNIAIRKLISLVNCFQQNWTDLKNKPDEFYSYRGAYFDKYTDKEIAEFALGYFIKDI